MNDTVRPPHFVGIDPSEQQCRSFLKALSVEINDLTDNIIGNTDEHEVKAMHKEIADLYLMVLWCIDYLESQYMPLTIEQVAQFFNAEIIQEEL